MCSKKSQIDNTQQNYTNSVELTGIETQTARLRAAFVAWSENATVGFNYAVTLTYPPSLRPKSFANLEHFAMEFCKKYNIEVGYGQNGLRKKTRNPRLSAPIIIINDGNGNSIEFHHHLALFKPEELSDEEFKRKVVTAWKSCFIDKKDPEKNEKLIQRIVIEVEPIETSGWNHYLASKLHIGNQEPFDVKNSNIY